MFMYRTTLEDRDMSPSRAERNIVVHYKRINASLWDKVWAGLLAANSERLTFSKFGIPFL